jgi:hypothetical protein
MVKESGFIVGSDRRVRAPAKPTIGDNDG